MQTIKTLEKNYAGPTTKEYVKLVQTHDEKAQDDRKYAVEVYIHTSDYLIATIHSATLYKSDMLFDALMRNYIY